MTRVVKNNAYATKYNEFISRHSLVAEEFEIFELELNYKDTSPLKSLLTLSSGIFFLITAMLWTYQMYLFAHVESWGIYLPLKMASPCYHP